MRMRYTIQVIELITKHSIMLSIFHFKSHRSQMKNDKFLPLISLYPAAKLRQTPLSLPSIVYHTVSAS